MKIRLMESADWPSVAAIYLERIARQHGVWRDTVILERRSGRVGG